MEHQGHGMLPLSQLFDQQVWSAAHQTHHLLHLTLGACLKMPNGLAPASLTAAHRAAHKELDMSEPAETLPTAWAEQQLLPVYSRLLCMWPATSQLLA